MGRVNICLGKSEPLDRSQVTRAQGGKPGVTSSEQLMECGQGEGEGDSGCSREGLLPSWGGGAIYGLPGRIIR